MVGKLRLWPEHYWPVILQIIENVVVAVGPMYPLVEKEKKVEYAQRTMSVLLNLYRRSQPPMVPTYPVTQCLASILQAAPTSAIEPLYDSLISVLGAMVRSGNQPMIFISNSLLPLASSWIFSRHFITYTFNFNIKIVSWENEPQSDLKDNTEALITINYKLAGWLLFF